MQILNAVKVQPRVLIQQVWGGAKVCMSHKLPGVVAAAASLFGPQCGSHFLGAKVIDTTLFSPEILSMLCALSHCLHGLFQRRPLSFFSSSFLRKLLICLSNIDSGVTHSLDSFPPFE